MVLIKNKKEQPKLLFQKSLSAISLCRFKHLSQLKAGSANADPFNRTVDIRLHPLKVRQPSPPACIVSMTHLVPVLGTLTAYITNSGHLKISVSEQRKVYINRADLSRRKNYPLILSTHVLTSPLAFNSRDTFSASLIR